MSYILEALKQSQQQRELGEIPTLTAEPFVENRPSGRLNPVLLATLLLALLSVVIALYALFSDRYPDVDNRDTDEGIISSAPVVKAPKRTSPPLPTEITDDKAVVRQESTQIKQPEKKVIAEKITLAVKTVTAQKITEKPIEAVSKKAPPAGTDIVQDEASAFRAEMLAIKRRLEETHSEMGIVEEPAETGKLSTKPAPEKSADNTPNTAVPSDPSGEKVKIGLPGTEHSLPQGIYARLPKRKVTIHVYSTDPSERFVILNSRRMEEGGRTSQGITVDEILQEGVIFSFEGHRFYKAL